MKRYLIGSSLFESKTIEQGKENRQGEKQNGRQVDKGVSSEEKGALQAGLYK